MGTVYEWNRRFEGRSYSSPTGVTLDQDDLGEIFVRPLGEITVQKFSRMQKLMADPKFKALMGLRDNR